MNAINYTADAELIILGEQLAAAIAAEQVAIAGLRASGEIENDAALTAVSEPADAIISQMRQHQPSTLLGFAAVQFAIAWVSGSLPSDLEEFDR